MENNCDKMDKSSLHEYKAKIVICKYEGAKSSLCLWVESSFHMSKLKQKCESCF
jgi:hypothetical protein